MNASSFILLFQRLRWQRLRNSFRVIQDRSLLRAVSILLCSALVWGSLFALCYAGFKEIDTKFGRLGSGLFMGTIFDILFASLTTLLIFSTGIIIYSSLFAAQESAFLLTTPIPADHVFSYKLQGAVAFSSWAFVLLGSPVLIAYGMLVKGGASWPYFLSLVLFFLGFILIPGTIGALLALLLVNIVPRDRKQLLAFVGLIVLVPLLLLAGRWVGMVRDPFGSRDWWRTIVNEIRPLRSNLLPSHWIADGLQAAAAGDLNTSVYYLALVWANGLFLYLAAVWVSRWLYRRGYNRMASGGSLRKKYGGEWLDRCVGRCLFFLDAQTKLLIMKDFRSFRRDPAQWFQIFIFVQLSVLYFWGMKSFYERDIGVRVQNGISLLTLLAISFLACAYTGRFIYPLLSMEGRKFWILGLLPLSRDRLIWGKFAFSAMGTLIVCVFLAVFANIMLNVPWQIVVVHTLTACVLSATLSGLSVGLGACMPNFRENDPSKIALGMGGTLNLVACLLVLVVVIVLMAGPWHFALIDDPELTEFDAWWLYAGPALGTLVGATASWFSLRMGIRTLRKLEF
jgi:ABC-2 type transport system permease protein